MTQPVTWRRLGPSHVTAETALSRGLELLDRGEPGDPLTLAWWSVGRDALVLGRGSRVEADEAACRAAGVRVLRRASGGGPVLWGPDLIALDVVVPKGHPLHSDDVVDSYRWLGEAFASALAGLAIPARVLTPEEARSTNDRRLADIACYAGRSPWEVLVDDHKVVGLSQVRRRQGTLLQAGFARRVDAPRLARLLGLCDADTAALVGAFARWPSLSVDAAALVDAVETAFAEPLGA